MTGTKLLLCHWNAVLFNFVVHYGADNAHIHKLMYLSWEVPADARIYTRYVIDEI